MANGEIIITAAGKQELENELEWRVNEKRPEISQRIKEAREFGDISENSEYDDAKNEQGQNEARISEIEHILANCVVDEASSRSNKIGNGTTVKVEMNGSEREFVIVGSVESDMREGKVSSESPVGSALFGMKKGEETVIMGPTGKEIKLKVLDIKQPKATQSK